MSALGTIRSPLTFGSLTSDENRTVNFCTQAGLRIANQEAILAAFQIESVVTPPSIDWVCGLYDTTTTSSPEEEVAVKQEIILDRIDDASDWN